MVAQKVRVLPLEHRAARYRAITATAELREIERNMREEPDRWLRKLLAMAIAERFPGRLTPEHRDYLALDVRTSL